MQSEDSLLEPGLSLHHWGPRTWIQVVGFGVRRLYLWRHPTMSTITPPLMQDLSQSPELSVLLFWLASLL